MADMDNTDEIKDFSRSVDLSKESILEFGVYTREAPKVCGDVFEALAGAVFLDSRSLQATFNVF